MLTPVDIHNQDFSRSFRGYDRDEIDDFLDRVVTDYETLYRENNQLKREIELNTKELTQFHNLEKNLQDTLLVAQRTSDEVISTANSRAEDIKQAAQQNAETIIHSAELEAKRLLDDAAQKVREAVTEYERIVTDKHRFIIKMRNILNSELALLGELENQMPDRQENMAPVNNKEASGNNEAAVKEESVNGNEGTNPDDNQ